MSKIIISNLHKSKTKNENIYRNKLVKNDPSKYNKQRPLLTNVYTFIQKLRHKFIHTSINKRTLNVESNINGLIDSHENLDEHGISNMVSSTETLDVGKIIDFDMLHEHLVDIDILFDNLISKIEGSTNSPQIENPDLKFDGFLDSFGSDDCNDISATITSIDSDISQFNDNGTTVSSYHDFDFDQKLISDFSVLGKLITILSPPPRSNERPIITDIENAKDFYCRKSEFRNFIDKLKLDFENVIVLDGNNKSYSKSDRLNNLSSISNKKKVNFSSDVCLCKTYADDEYNRSDSHIANVLDAFENPEYVQLIRSEINGFKLKEMIVHEDSKSFTHFI